MRKQLIITNAMAIAFSIIRDEISNHVVTSTGPYSIEVTIFFDLDDERVIKTKNMVRQATSFTAEIQNKKFYEDNFETLNLRWEF